MTKMTNKDIDEKFFRAYLRDEVVRATDFTTLMAHDVQFIDPDYHQFVYGMLWSAKVNKKKTYFYIIVKIGNELSDVFLKSILREVITDKIIVWHKKNFPRESKNPTVACITFECDKKS